MSLELLNTSTYSEMPSPQMRGKPLGLLRRQLTRDAALAAMQLLMDDLPEQVALLSEDCSIVAANTSWLKAMSAYGYSGVAIGDNYRDKCREIAAEGYEPAVKVLAALDQMLSGVTSFWQLMFKGRGEWISREYQITFHRVTVGTQAFVTVTRFDRTEIEELRRANKDVRQAEAEGQAAERQRLTRELHDSISQLLVGTQLLAGSLKSKITKPDLLAIVQEIQNLVTDAQQEVRSISHLAQPPALEKFGFVDALKRLVEGFGARSGLIVSMQVVGECEIVWSEARTGLYRVVQESLSNILRHAHATEVSVSLISRRGITHVVIRDNGCGIKNVGDCGVGLSGMQARLRELGGRLSVRSLMPGTAILASLPITLR